MVEALGSEEEEAGVEEGWSSFLYRHRSVQARLMQEVQGLGECKTELLTTGNGMPVRAGKGEK